MPHVAGAVTTADRLLPGSARLSIQIDDVHYHVRPLPADAERAVAIVRLLPKVGGVGKSATCVEYADTEDGLQVEGYLGLGCDCPDADGVAPCRHLRALVAVGLLRPHPGWDDLACDELPLINLEQRSGR